MFCPMRNSLLQVSIETIGQIAPTYINHSTIVFIVYHRLHCAHLSQRRDFRPVNPSFLSVHNTNILSVTSQAPSIVTYPGLSPTPCPATQVRRPRRPALSTIHTAHNHRMSGGEEATNSAHNMGMEHHIDRPQEGLAQGGADDAQ